MKFWRCFFYVLLVAIARPTIGWAQTLTNTPYNPVPASPTTTALTQYAHVPVSLATGTPQISIPLYTIQCGQLSLPLSLSYHGGGFKVSEQASWVGLGWSLNASGVIKRTIQGKPDNGEFERCFADYQTSPLGPDAPLNPDGTVYAPTYYFLETLATGGAVNGIINPDGIPDRYSFNFMGHSGTFIRPFGRTQLSPQQPLAFEGWASNQSTASQYAVPAIWTVVDEAGTTYTFAATETTSEVSRNGGTTATSNVMGWYLTQVVSSSTQDTIRFFYTDNTLQVPASLVDVFTIDRTEYSPSYNSFSQNGSSAFAITGKYLQRITFTGGQVEFYAYKERTDVQDDVRLDSLVLRTPAQERHFVLQYATRDAQDRLQLQTLSERSVREPLPPLVHRFRYRPEKLPAVTSRQQDAWGYYNGKPNLSLLPVMAQYPNGGNREADPSFGQAELLTRITYPTGGYSAFAYEGHDTGRLPATTPTVTQELCSAYAGPGSPLVSGVPTTVTEFTVPFEQDVTVSYYMVNIISGGRAGYPIQLFRCDENGNCPQTTPLRSYQTANSTSANPYTSQLHLSAGKYSILVRASSQSYQAGEVSITITGQVYQAGPTHLPYIGGVRLRADTLFDGFSHTRDMVRTYRYRAFNDPAQSSGIGSITIPNYHNSALARYGVEGGGVKDPNIINGDGNNYMPCQNLFPQYIDTYRASTQSSYGGDIPVYYEQVAQTVQGIASSGTTHYYYEGTGGNLEGPVGPPFVPRDDALRPEPRLLQQVDLHANGDTVRRVVNRYACLDSLTRLTYGYGYVTTPRKECYNNTLQDPHQTPHQVVHCLLQSRFEYLAQQWEYSYATSASSSLTRKPQVITTLYQYDNLRHLLPTRVQRVVGAGDTLTTLTRYPLDYATPAAGNAATAGLRLLQSIHRLNTPVEQIQWRSRGAGRQVTAGVLHHFQSLALPPVRVRNNAFMTPYIPVPTQDDVLRLAAPLPLAQFSPAAVTTAGQWQQAPQYEPQVVYRQYNTQGRPTRVHRAGELPSAYWWSTTTPELLAVVKPATPATSAFTSFELNSPGGWDYTPGSDNVNHLVYTDARTGRVAYRLDGGRGVRRDNLPAGDYELLFWAQQRPQLLTSATITAEQVLASASIGSIQWQQFRLRLHLPASGSIEFNAVDAAHAILLDEVRLHPVGAQMTSYTYDSLVGTTSQTDASGRTLTYEYDGLGRLVCTRDEQGRLLSQQEYHYVRP